MPDAAAPSERMSPAAGAAPGRPAVRAWWAHPAVAGGVLLLSTAPLWFAPLPPLIDLLGHMGRYHIELALAHSPALQRNWDFHWRVLGNLGVDLAIAPLAAVLGLERAVWLVALALPPLMIWGMMRISRAVHGGITPFVLAAAPFAAGFPYQYGFVNYWLGCALAFHVFASWVARRQREPFSRSELLFAAAACGVWLAHAYGWAILVVLVVAFELGEAWRANPAAWPSAAVAAARRSWPVLVPAGLMLIWRQGAGGPAMRDFFDLHLKWLGLRETLRDQNAKLDLLSLVFAGWLIVFGLASRAARTHRGLSIAFGLFLALVLLLPAELLGSAYADVRLWPIIFIVGLTAVARAGRPSAAASVIAGAALALFIVRVVVSAAGFAGYERSYDSHLRALAFAPRGASIAVLTSVPDCYGWRLERVAHLGSLAIVRQDAFVNTQWDNPGGQLLTPLHARGTAFNADPSQYVGALQGCGGDVRPWLAARIGQIPRDRFQYLWLLGFEPRLFAGVAGARRLYADDRSAFFQLNPAPPATAGAAPQARARAARPRR